jgi:hypothetical protein
VLEVSCRLRATDFPLTVLPAISARTRAALKLAFSFRPSLLTPANEDPRTCSSLSHGALSVRPELLAFEPLALFDEPAAAGEVRLKVPTHATVAAGGAL